MQDDVTEAQDSPSAEAKESIQEYEARVSTEGIQIQEEAPEEIPETQEDPVETPEAVAEPKGPDLAQVLAAQAEATNRQTQLLELLAKVREEAPKASDAEPTLSDNYTRMLTDRRYMAEVMRHEDIDLDPTLKNDVALFRNMVSHELEKEVAKAKDNRIAALEEKLKGWEVAAQTQFKAREAKSVWAEATKDFNLDPELHETLHSAVNALVQDGTSPKEAVAAILKPFLKLLPRKEGATPTRDPEAARAIAAAAITGKGANRITPFKRGTTDTASIKDFEAKFFRNN